MNEPREPLRPLDYIILAGLAFYVLAVAVGAVWLLIQIARLIHASGYGETICGIAILLLMAAVVVATPRK